MNITPLIAGNWKMNGLRASLGEVTRLTERLDAAEPGRVEIAICPPATLISEVRRGLGDSPIRVGAQDCHTAESGAHTGDISAAMLADAGASMVILGHSERRSQHAETDGVVRLKAQMAVQAGLAPIICVGETLPERQAGLAETVCTRQLIGSVPDEAVEAGLVIAYEPVWAIGTGVTPSSDDIFRMHASLRAQLVKRFGAAGEAVRLLYGGSVKPANAREILALGDVNGALVGGASLLADDFAAIISAA